MDKKPINIKRRLIIFIVILGMVLAYNISVFSTHNEIYYSDANAEIENFKISNNAFEQHFFADEAIRQIEIALFPEEGQTGKNITVTAKLFEAKTDKLLASDEQTLDSISQIEYFTFKFPDTESATLTEYYLVLSTQGNTDLYAKTNLNEYEEKLLYGGDLINQRLIFKVIYANNLLLGFFWLTLILLILALLLLIFPWKFNLRPEILFILIALVSGITMTFVVPTGQEPDTGDHILRSFDVSYGNLTPVFGKANDRSIQMPDNFPIFNDTVLNPNQNLGLSRLSDMLHDQFTAEMGQNYDYRYKMTYSILTYYPQGLGLYIGRLLTLNEYYMLALARLFNLAAYILLTYFAIRHIPEMKNLLLFLALMPISIYQASSLSADALINGLLFLFVAMIIKLARQVNKISLYQLLPAAFVLYLVFNAKAAYIGLALMFLFIPFSNYRTISKRVIQVIFYFAIAATVGVVAAGFNTGRLMLNEGAPEYTSQLEFVLHNLIPTFRIFMHTINQYGSQYISWLNYLGWLTYPLGILVYLVPFAIIFIGLFDQRDDLNNNNWQKFAVIGTLILSLAGIFIGLYMFDDVNAIGANLMLGVQGRYFIPFFLLPFLIFKRPFQIQKKSDLTLQVAGISGVFLTYSVLTLLKMIY